MKLDVKCRILQKGFIFLPILLTLTLVAVVAILVTRESSMQAEQIVRDQTPTQDRYVGLAGLEIGQKQLQSDLDCTNYQVDATNSFANTSFASTISATSGSPITLNVNVDPNGSNLNFSREITMFDANSPAPDITLSVTEGTYLRSDNKDTNYNDSDTWHVKHNFFSPDRVSLMKFDLSSVDIPVEYIVSATLEMHTAGSAESQTHTINLHRITVDWNEAEATYNDRVSGTAWENSDLDWNAVSSTTVDESVVGWKYFDATELVKAWLNGDYPNYGLELVGQVLSSNNLELISDTHADTDKHPVLRISYLCECGQTCSEPEDEAVCGVYTPGEEVKDMDTSAHSREVVDLVKLSEGKLFRGTTVPMGGGWLLADKGWGQIHLLNQDGAKIQQQNVGGGGDIAGIDFIASGTYTDHYLVAIDSPAELRVHDGNFAQVTSISLSGVSVVEDASYIGTTKSGTYDDMFVVLSEADVLHIYDQAGTEQTQIDLSSAGLSDPVNAYAVNEKDAFLILDNGDKTLKEIDYSGNVSDAYSFSSLISDVVGGFTIDPDTCDQVYSNTQNDHLVFLNEGVGGLGVQSMTLLPAADTYIDASWLSFSRNKNYGADPELQAGFDLLTTEHKSLIKFDVSGIPSGATIVSAKLRLFPGSLNSLPVRFNVHKILTAWTESGATWNNMGDDAHRDSNVEATYKVPSWQTTWSEVLLPTSLIDEWRATLPLENNGIMLETTLLDLFFKSRQSGVFAPQLLIEYTEP